MKSNFIIIDKRDLEKAKDEIPDKVAEFYELLGFISNWFSSDKSLLYLGNYGYNPTSIPLELDSNVAKWIEEKLTNMITMNNRIGWAVEILKTLSNMLDERDEKWFAKQLEDVIGKINEIV